MVLLIGFWMYLLAAAGSVFSFFSPDINNTKKPADEEKVYIMVIPFSHQMYKNNGDHFICKSSDVTPGELTDMLRRSTESTMIYNLSEYYNAVGVKENNYNMPESDISKLYNIFIYKQKTQKLKAYHKGYPPFKLKQIFAPPHVRWGSDCVNNSSPKPNVNRHSYAFPVVNNDDVYQDILAKHKAVYSLFITQFEMNTRFKTCIDLQRNVFQRDIYLHYALIDVAGNVIDGGVVGTTYQSPSNDIHKIMEKNLGMLSAFIAERVRKKLS